jgi:hypothetical protein
MIPLEKHNYYQKRLDSRMTQETSTVLLFPFQMHPAHECEYLRDGIFQAKLQAAQMLNQVAAGTLTMSVQTVRSLKWLNSKCLEVGLSPLIFATNHYLITLRYKNLILQCRRKPLRNI